MRDWQPVAQAVGRVLEAVADEDLDDLAARILGARNILVYGVGREGLVMKAFAMRLFHLGLNTSVVGDVTAPPAGVGTLFVASVGPGWLSTVQALVQQARTAGADCLLFTAETERVRSWAGDADCILLPAQTMARTESGAEALVMGGQYELALWVVFDLFIQRLASRMGETPGSMAMRHTNME